MKIGGAWTRTSEKTGKTFISAVLDGEFLELCPQLKNCSIMLTYISTEDRKTEKSPAWSVNLVKNNENYKKQNKSEAETSETSENPVINNEEIYF